MTQVGVGGNLRGVSIVELESAEQAARLVKVAKNNRSDPSHQITSVEVIHRDVAAGAVIRSRSVTMSHTRKNLLL